MSGLSSDADEGKHSRVTFIQAEEATQSTCESACEEPQEPRKDFSLFFFPQCITAAGHYDLDKATRTAWRERIKQRTRWFIFHMDLTLAVKGWTI